MSWSVGATGRPKAVAPVIEKQFTGALPCSEPEETVRQAARAAIAAALAGQTDPACAVKVTANGSQSQAYKDGKPLDPPVCSNSLFINVEVLWGFAE